MIASSSTFCPHPGRIIRDLFRQLHAVWHGMEALVYSNHPIVCLTLGLSRGMNGVTQSELSFLLLLWGLSDPRIAELRKMSFSIKLYSETQVSGRLGMSGGRSPRHAQNPLSGERKNTLSITHHALSPSHHHLYTSSLFHLIN